MVGILPSVKHLNNYCMLMGKCSRTLSRTFREFPPNSNQLATPSEESERVGESAKQDHIPGRSPMVKLNREAREEPLALTAVTSI